MGERQKGVVEYVIGGSRMKIRSDEGSDSIIFAFFFSGAKCESVPNAKKIAGGAKIPPFAEEARDYTREICMHRDVEFEIEGSDNYGAAKGQLWVNKRNVALLLVEKGYARATPNSRGGNHHIQAKIEVAEQNAKDQKLGIWKNYDPVAEAKAKAVELQKQKEATTPKAKEVVQVTEVLDGGFCYLQFVNEGQQKLKALMDKIAEQDWDAQPPYTKAKVGQLVVSKFSDGTWYRAEVIKIEDDGQYRVRYGDYGNIEVVDASRVRELTTGEFSLSVLAFQAHPAVLAYIQPRTLDQDWGKEAAECFKHLVWGKNLYATVPYTETNTDRITGRKETTLHVTLVPVDDNKIFVNGVLVAEGLAKVDKKARNDKIIKYLRKEQESAFKNRYGLWEYGDDGSDDEEKKM